MKFPQWWFRVPLAVCNNRGELDGNQKEKRMGCARKAQKHNRKSEAGRQASNLRQAEERKGKKQ